MAISNPSSRKKTSQSPKKTARRLPKLEPGEIPVDGKWHPAPTNKRTATRVKKVRGRSHTKIDQARKDRESHALSEIKELIESRTREDTISIKGMKLKELDEIADYVPPSRGPWKIEAFAGESIYLDDGGSCVCNVLPSLDWWRQVATRLAEMGQDDNFETLPAFKPQHQRLLSLLSDVFQAYVPAERASFNCSPGNSALKLLRCYRLYTRHICELAEEIWPLAHLDPLQKLV
jgi:hypothetical protein